MTGDQALVLLYQHDRERMAGMFTRHYTLQGKDWVRRISAEDRQIFVQIGLLAACNGHLGGVARAASASRDRKGRFV